MNFSFEPVAYVRNDSAEFYQVPYQVGVLPEMRSIIEFERGQNFEMALKDLDGFERVWIVFVFDRAKNWKPIIQPPRGDKKVGVFASRSPHRPNAIGISAVELERIDGLKLYIKNHDFLDGTPVLDVKPYIPGVDSYDNSAIGWLSSVEPLLSYELVYSETVNEQLAFLRNKHEFDIMDLAEVNIKTSPFPRSNNRIKHLDENLYIMSVKTWRLLYRIEEQSILIEEVKSGYDQATLSGEKKSKWDDVWLHQKFVERFE
jgi:tRNA (adenine37-N6)-methyltransferase